MLCNYYSNKLLKIYFLNTNMNLITEFAVKLSTKSSTICSYKKLLFIVH